MRHFILSLSLLASLSAISYGEIAVIVNPDNPISKLSKKDIQRLFLGRLQRFPDSDLKVESIDNDEGSQLYQSFYKQVINMSASKLKRYRAYYLFSGKGKLPEPLANSSRVISHVASSKNAIGYVNSSDVNKDVKVDYISQ